MSKPRDNWRPYVVNAMRDYYSYKGRQKLTEQETLELEAIEKAIKETSEKPDGADRIKVIDIAFFQKDHTIDGAAMKIPTSCNTARRWTDNFIRLVAKNLGLK